MKGGPFAGEFQSSAQLVGAFRGDFWQYTTGIERVIELILEDFAKARQGSAAADTLVYPLGLLSRHLIELRLKQLYLEVHGAPAAKHHNILELWRDLRAEIERVWPNASNATEREAGTLARRKADEGGRKSDDQNPLDTLGTRIKAYHDLDKSGQNFRYPGSFKKGTHPVSLDRLGATALEISELLDAFHTAFYENNRLRGEVEAELAAEMGHYENP